MTVHLRLRHVWGGTVNGASSNIILLAAQDAGLRGARQIAPDLIIANGRVVTLPFKPAEYLARLRRYADRIEALPEDAQRALNAEASRLSKKDARNAKAGRDTFTPISGDFPLMTFNLEGV